MSVSCNFGADAFAKFRFASPMLISRAKSSHLSNSILKKDWVFERKYDGIRCIVVKNQNKVSLYSRNRIDYTPHFPELTKAFKSQKGNFVVDGEIISNSLYSLQKRIKCKNPEKKIDTNISIKLFDILNDNGVNIMQRPYLERKKALKNCINFNKTIGYVQHRYGSKQAFLKESRQKGWEGIIAKKIDSPYENKRSRNTLKFINLIQRDFYICGFKLRKDGKGMIGTLILGCSPSNLEYSGRVYLGLSKQMNLSIRKTILRHARTTPTVCKPTRKKERIIWVQPRWKVKVAFLAYSSKGYLRSPRLVVPRDKMPIFKA